MERRGGCCIYAYGGGDAAAAWRMGRIMLRFRPIAPKPVVDSPWAASVAAAAAEATASSVGRKTGRNSSGGPRGRKARKVETSRSSSSSKDDPASSSPSAMVTLSLMPETPEMKDDRVVAERRCLGSEQPLAAAAVPAWTDRGRAGEKAEVAWPATAVGSYSWVTVECVADMWKEEEVSWRSDEAVWAAMAADDCPGFVSDVWDRVTWTNEAYRRMVAGMPLESRGTEDEEEDVWVGLITRGAVPAEASRAFTCRVRVHYSRRPGRGKGGSCSSSLAAPCDVWRLNDGGSAWRLDLKAALSLSL